MVAERFSKGIDFFEGWRCITCGEIVDKQILENRIRPRKSIKVPKEDRAEMEEWSGR
jgi:hypothetical protein